MVPRTFIGPLIISALSAPIGALLYLFGINKFWMQYVGKKIIKRHVSFKVTFLNNNYTLLWNLYTFDCFIKLMKVFAFFIAARLTLALTVIATWSRLRNTLRKQYGNTFAWWFTLVTVSQYHFMFYMSRPLPNILALPLGESKQFIETNISFCVLCRNIKKYISVSVLLAFEGWMSGSHKQFLISAGASMIIFRAELAVLFGLFLIIDLYFKKIDVVM